MTRRDHPRADALALNGPTDGLWLELTLEADMFDDTPLTDTARIYAERLLSLEAGEPSAPDES